MCFQVRRALFTAGFYTGKAVRSFLALAVCELPCVLCGKPALSVSLCRECRTQLDKEAVHLIADSKRCCNCGRPLLSEHDICTTCREKPVFKNIAKAFPLFTYVLSKKKLLYSWKIGSQHNLTEVFADYTAEIMRVHFSNAVVVPVPPRPGKLRKTSWDQIEDLARHLEYKHGISVMRILRRTEAVQQKKLSKEERAEHSRKAYVLDAVRFQKAELCESTSIVLLDDVITTGNTISACAEILEEAGFRNVSAVSLFIVPG